jgi:hypothetical protein
LLDLSLPTPTVEEPIFVIEAAEEIFRIMTPYYKSRMSLGKDADEHLIAIGKSLYEQGGDAAMKQAFKKVSNLSHRRLGYLGNHRYLEMTWHGIGDWWG